MSQDGGNTVPRITKAEHIGPNDTGDNIEAKRVANYIWNGSAWVRETASGGGGGSGTEYTDGDPAPTNPIGGIPVFDDAGTITAVSDTNPLPVSATIDTTGLATSAKQDSQTTELQDIEADIEATNTRIGEVQASPTANTVLDRLKTLNSTLSGQQTDALTDTELRAAPVEVDTGLTQPTTPADTQPVSGTFWQATQPVSHAALTELAAAINTDKVDVNIASGNITGFATSAKQDTIIGHVDGIETLITSTNTKLDTVVSNQQSDALTDAELRASALPVSLASVPSHAVTNAGTFAVQAAQSGTWNITNISGTVSLPTGASTSANQTTIIGHLDGVETSLTNIDTDTSDLLTEMRVMNGAAAMRVDDTTGTLYQGWAEPGTLTSAAGWRIRKIVTSGTPEDNTITFADGDRNFNNVWDDRASLSYS